MVLNIFTSTNHQQQEAPKLKADNQGVQLINRRARRKKMYHPCLILINRRGPFGAAEALEILPAHHREVIQEASLQKGVLQQIPKMTQSRFIRRAKNHRHQNK